MSQENIILEKDTGKNIVIYLWENLSDVRDLLNKISYRITNENIKNDNCNMLYELAKLIGKIDILFYLGIKNKANDNIPEAMINILDQISLIYMNLIKNGKIDFSDIAKLENEKNVLFDLIDNL